MSKGADKKPVPFHKMTYEDFVGAGFHKVESIKTHPPKIKWGKLYQDSPIDKRLAFAEKLAAAMNHAAFLIQEERDELAKLCEKKEAQIEAMHEALQQNNNMIQTQITKMNAQMQEAAKRSASLQSRIRQLENGNNG